MEMMSKRENKQRLRICNHVRFTCGLLSFGTYQTSGSVKILFVTVFHSTDFLESPASSAETVPVVQLQGNWNTWKELGKAQSAGSNQRGLPLPCRELKDFPWLYQLVALTLGWNSTAGRRLRAEQEYSQLTPNSQLQLSETPDSPYK